MAKLWQYFTFIVIIDMMFYLFVNTTAVSLTGVIFRAIVAIASGGGWDAIGLILTNDLLIRILAGAALALVATGIYVKLSGTTFDIQTFLWTGVVSAFFLSLGADFINIFRVLSSIKPPITTILAMIMMVPIIISFTFILIEWIRGKD